MRKYISPGAWFALEYPDDWREFEDTENSFLFYNPERWNGNFRISAYGGENGNYAKECLDYELRQTKGARRVKVGNWECVYSAESFQENGVEYVSHFWVTGRENISIECSFTTATGGSVELAEGVIASLRVHAGNEKPWKEIIPVRLLEINVIDECYEWAVSVVKKRFAKDFTSSESDIANLQKVIDGGCFNKDQRQAWSSLGVAFGTILVNEMDGMDWVTVIDGKREFPALRFGNSGVMVYPMDLIWEKVRKNQVCDLKAEYARIKTEVEAAMN